MVRVGNAVAGGREANKGDVCEQGASTEWGLIKVEERELPAIWTRIMDLK